MPCNVSSKGCHETTRGWGILAYRVAELADAADVSVDLVRSYQTKGLLDGPRRAGRVALYDERHLQRLRWIKGLKDKGYSLKAIGGLLDRPRTTDGERAVAAAVATTAGPSHDDERLDLGELAERTRVPLSLLRSLEASGIIRARRAAGAAYYTGGDVRAVRMLLTLIGVGLPLEEFMRLAHLQIATSQEVAAGALELYAKYVEEPLRQRGMDPDEASERSDAAFGILVQAATSLVAYSFERTLRSARAARTRSL
ncbi:MAG: MerR family transcriptional regulator [Acidimicrobiia bacterium]